LANNKKEVQDPVCPPTTVKANPKRSIMENKISWLLILMVIGEKVGEVERGISRCNWSSSRYVHLLIDSHSFVVSREKRRG
jgi:hypothetical protein